MRVCLLHVGTHKTGTTSLQQLLGTNDEALSAAGVCVPKRGRPFETAAVHGAHHNVAWQFIGDSRFNPSAGTLADVISEIRDARKPVALLSSEDFEYLHSRPAALFHIRRELEAAGFKLKIILYLRRQDDYARSLYSELLNHGWDRTVEQYVDAILMDGMIVYRNAWVFEFLYSRLLASFAVMLGAENVIVRQFIPQIDNSALPVDFMTVIRNEGVDLRFSDLRFPERLNQSKTDGSVSADLFQALRSRFSADNAIVRDRYGVDLSRWTEAQPMASNAQYSIPIFG